MPKCSSTPLSKVTICDLSITHGGIDKAIQLAAYGRMKPCKLEEKQIQFIVSKLRKHWNYEELNGHSNCKFNTQLAKVADQFEKHIQCVIKFNQKTMDNSRLVRNWGLSLTLGQEVYAECSINFPDYTDIIHVSYTCSVVDNTTPDFIKARITNIRTLVENEPNPDWVTTLQPNLIVGQVITFERRSIEFVDYASEYTNYLPQEQVQKPTRLFGIRRECDERSDDDE